MFTVKFYKSYDDSESMQSSFSCQSYQVYQRANGSYEVSMHSGMIHDNGVAVNVSKEPEHYQQCYVENMAGKTIDTIRA